MFVIGSVIRHSDLVIPWLVQLKFMVLMRPEYGVEAFHDSQKHSKPCFQATNPYHGCMKVTEILETCIYAKDLASAEEFYRGVLGLEVIARQEGRHAFFRCGNRMFLVFNPAKTLEAGTEFPPHGTRGATHAAFGVRGDELPAWREYLEQHGVVIENEVTWPNGGRSLYFRDPAGNSLELATPRIWSIAEEALFGKPRVGGRDSVEP